MKRFFFLLLFSLCLSTVGRAQSAMYKGAVEDSLLSNRLYHAGITEAVKGNSLEAYYLLQNAYNLFPTAATAHSFTRLEGIESEENTLLWQQRAYELEPSNLNYAEQYAQALLVKEDFDAFYQLADTHLAQYPEHQNMLVLYLLSLSFKEQFDAFYERIVLYFPRIQDNENIVATLTELCGEVAVKSRRRDIFEFYLQEGYKFFLKNPDYAPRLINHYYLFTQDVKATQDYIESHAAVFLSNFAARQVYTMLLYSMGKDAEATASLQITLADESQTPEIRMGSSARLCTIESLSITGRESILKNLEAFARQHRGRMEVVTSYLSLLSDLGLPDQLERFAFSLLQEPYEHKEELWVGLLRFYLESGEVGKFKKQIEVALKEFPRSPYLYVFRSMVEVFDKEYNKALGSIDNAIAYIPEDKPQVASSFYSQKAEILQMLNRELSEVLAAYEAGLQYNEADAILLNNYAYALLKLQTPEAYSKAERLAAQALAQDDENPFFLDTYALSLFKVGKNEEAILYMGKACKKVEAVSLKDPSNKELQYNLFRYRLRYAYFLRVSEKLQACRQFLIEKELYQPSDDVQEGSDTDIKNIDTILQGAIEF